MSGCALPREVSYHQPPCSAAGTAGRSPEGVVYTYAGQAQFIKLVILGVGFIILKIATVPTSPQYRECTYDE